MWIANTSWISRLLVAAPFAIAALLNALMLGVEHLHLHLAYIARYWLVFSGPWVWLVSVVDLTNHVRNPWFVAFIFYVSFLWIPAILYSVCVCLLLVALKIGARRMLNHLDPDVVKILKRRTTIIFSMVVVAALSWFALKLCLEQIACNKRGEALALRIESIKHDANEKLSIGTKRDDVSRFFVEHGIPLEIVESEAFGTLYTVGCGPLGCGTGSALIGVRLKLDSAGAVAEKPTVVGMYTNCL